ncbi:hypothetical protein K435DRAFT_959124 [Dendrothele bispora CBS 962.96]|uniref:Uncharacterized protein n=1 Tax=Dendrothele bispora (strain CBS 962.96) TaxID=1314807 RepID=A0A4S8MYQ1_DENBC|nr:hypothetical protein K435DRAFT_959124 [Dendrothele bispora CBS 962.96]
MDSSGPSKRVYTDAVRDDIRASNTFSASMNSDPDLAAKLRSVAMRARKRVTEGYMTNTTSSGLTSTSSRNFAKAQSTGTIFSSSQGPLQIQAQKLKRRRSQSELDEEINDSPNTDVEGNEAPDTAMLLDGKEGRPVKPLRNKSKAMMATMSLPALPLNVQTSLSASEPNQEPVDHGNGFQEDDWSMDASSFEIKQL